MKPFNIGTSVDAYRQLAAQMTRDVHSDVVMTEAYLGKIMLQQFGWTAEPGGAREGDMLHGTRLHTQKTMLGAQFRALMLSCMEQRTVLLVFEDGHADTVRWK